MIQDFFRDGGISTVTVDRRRGLRRLAVDVQHGRPLRLVVHVGLHRPQADVHDYLGVGMILYALLAIVGGTSTVVVRARSRAVIISFYGGGFATVPAYLRDLFGTYQVGAIHGRLLTAWSTAGDRRAADHQRHPRRAGRHRASSSPPTTGPRCSPWSGVLAVGFVANLLIRPVAARWHERSGDNPLASAGVREGADQAMTSDETEPAEQGGQLPRLVLSWLVVGVPLVYGVVEAVKSTLPLFGG